MDFNNDRLSDAGRVRARGDGKDMGALTKPDTKSGHRCLYANKGGTAESCHFSSLCGLEVAFIFLPEESYEKG